MTDTLQRDNNLRFGRELIKALEHAGSRLDRFEVGE
jgi:hypothetical protein